MHAPSTHVSLLERLASSEDQEAWQVFCERYGSLIRDYGRRRGLQPSDCDDLLQDVLLSLSKAMPGFTYDPQKGRLRSYLKAITMRAISRRARQNDGVRALDTLEGVEDPAAEEDAPWEEAWRQHHVRRALERMRSEFNERTLTAFSLYVLEGRPAQEAAEVLGASVEVVYQSKSRILKRLSELVAEQVRDEG